MENYNMKINLIPFMSEAFSINKKIYKLIDELYKKDKFKFYKSAKENEWYTHPIASEGSLEQESYFKKTLGILLNSKKYADELNNIVKKGWHYAYNYTKNNDVILVEKFLAALIKRHGGIDEITDDEMNSNIIALLFLADEKVNKESEALQYYINSLLLRVEHYKDDCKLRVNYNNINEEDFKKIRELKNKLVLNFGNFKILNGTIISEKLKSYIDMVDSLFDYENTSLIAMCDNIKFTDRDIEEILYLWVKTGYNETESLESTAKFLVDMTRLKNFCKAYKVAKQFHFQNNKETMYIELELEKKKTEELQIKLSLETSKVKELTNKIKNIESDEIKELKEKLKKTEKENKNLKNQIYEDVSAKNELNSLREFMFNLDSRIEEIPEKISTGDLEKLQLAKAIIVGGTLKWQHRMKELLTNFNFIAPEAINFDAAVINNVDYIFFYTNYLSHAMYYKIMANINKNQKITYIEATNEDLVLSQISQAIKNI